MEWHGADLPRVPAAGGACCGAWAEVLPRQDHGGAGLPTKDKRTGWQAADTWAVFAADPDGASISCGLHDVLRAQGLWVWTAGCIEDVTGFGQKGEDAILAQELAIEKMDAEEIEKSMPQIKCCFDWLDGLRGSASQVAA